METCDFKIQGVSPLIIHSSQLSDPLNAHTKSIAEISGKRKKTEADHIELGHREFLGSMYLLPSGAPCIPSQNIERMFRDAAAKSKQGKQVQAGLLVTDDVPIIYKGPKDVQALWDSGKFAFRASAKIGQQRVMRTRPCFQEWQLEFSVIVDETQLSLSQVMEFLVLGGRTVGLGDWRPKHGRFDVIS